MNFWKNLHPLIRRSNGDHTTNSAMLDAIVHELTLAEESTKDKKFQLTLNYASGHYLDTWGLWFNTPRKHDQSDSDLWYDILETVKKPSSTVPSIIDGAESAIDDEAHGVNVYEPWKNIFTLNASKLNGDDHLEGDYFRYGVVEVQLPTDVVSQTLVDRLLAVKPAGVFMYILLSNGKRYLLSNNKYQDEEHIYKDDFVKVLYGSNQV